MGRLHDLDPALGPELARRDLLADVVAQDLGRRARHGPETRIDEVAQVVREWHLARAVPEVDLFR